MNALPSAAMAIQENPGNRTRHAAVRHAYGVAGALLLLSGLSAGPAGAQQPAARAPLVRVWTEAGTFDVQLDPVSAPRTVANFLWYVEQGAYQGGRVHRTVTTAPDNQPNNTVKIDVIQAGPRADFAAAPPIPLERTSVTGLRHEDGTISMARGGPDTATGDFFICVGAQPSLDFGGQRNPDGQGFAAFGRVVRGMEIVRKIHQASANGQTLAPPVGVTRIELVPAGRTR